MASQDGSRRGTERQGVEALTGIMERYANAVERSLMAVGWFVEGVARVIAYYGRYLLAGLLLAVTMPVWYLPYKYFTGKGEKRK